jgi:hypothetical protein
MARLDFNYDRDIETLKDFKEYIKSIPDGASFSGHYLKHVRTGLNGQKLTDNDILIEINGIVLGQVKLSEFWNVLINAPFPKTQQLIDKANSQYDDKGNGTFYIDGPYTMTR